jgi:hypothetical protein
LFEFFERAYLPLVDAADRETFKAVLARFSVRRWSGVGR